MESSVSSVSSVSSAASSASTTSNEVEKRNSFSDESLNLTKASSTRTTTPRINTIHAPFKYNVLPYLDAPSLDLLKKTNKELKGTTQDYTSIFLKNTGLFGFMTSIKESDISRLKPDIRDQLLSNPINHVIPQQYISKYMTQILLNDGIPCKVFSNAAAFCAVLDNGSVLAWGSPDFGSTPPTIPNDRTVSSVYSGRFAFCAILDDGALVTWGDPDYGGITPTIPDGRTISSVFSADYAFCAVLDNGSVVSWGDPDYGGTTPTIPDGRTVRSVFSSTYAFCAVLDDGSLITWGSPRDGGTAPTIYEDQSLAFFS